MKRINRRRFLKTAAGVSFVAGTGLIRNDILAAESKRPNILFVMTDQQFADAELPSRCKGLSLRPIAEGRAIRKRRAYVACSTHFAQDRLPDGSPINLKGRMIRTDRFKYYIFDQGEQPEMLIDMQNDPGEMVNLVGDPAFKEILRKHRAYLRQYAKATKDKLVQTLLERL